MTANSTRPPITILLTHFRAKIISPSPEGRSASPFDSGLTGEDVEIKYTSAAASPKPNVVDKRRWTSSTRERPATEKRKLKDGHKKNDLKRSMVTSVWLIAAGKVNYIAT